MKHYFDITDFQNCQIQVSFMGMEFEEKDCPKTSDIFVRLLSRTNDDGTTPYTVVWESVYKDVEVPEGAWHGVKLAQITERLIILAIGNSIKLIDRKTRKLVWEKVFEESTIKEIRIDSLNTGVYILHKGYDLKTTYKEVKSNFIKIDLFGRVVWSPKFEFNNKLEYITGFITYDGILTIYTGACFRYKLIEKNWEIIEHVFTK